MPAHSLGERRPITTRLHPSLIEDLHQLRRDAGVKTMSQFVADLLALHAGRPELVRELDKEEPGTLLSA